MTSCELARRVALDVSDRTRQRSIHVPDMSALGTPVPHRPGDDRSARLCDLRNSWISDLDARETPIYRGAAATRVGMVVA